MKTSRRKNTAITYFLFVMGVLLLAQPVSATISPEELIATLRAGQCITETKTVEVADLPARADVIFAFDLTGSMSSIIETAKDQAEAIITALDGLGVDVQYGVMSYMDYNGSYSLCEYSAPYGSGPDYPYNLGQAITDDETAVLTAINSLSIGNGDDGPQDYTRIFYESYADPSVGWRPGAKRILVNFGDNVPHDCDLNQDIPGTSGTWTTGGDPGPDGIMGNGDDLDLQTVLAEMNSNGVTLIECHTADWPAEYEGGPVGFNILDFWDIWTGITGGDVYLTDSATLVDDVVGAVTAALTTPDVYDLHLEASSGYESWIDDVEPSSYDVDPPADVEFDLTICVPEGTPDGEYNFTISAVDEDGVSYGDQDVTITVLSVEFAIDIKPGSCPNPFNGKSEGSVPVAIIGTDALDVTTIDLTSIRLEDVPIMPGHAHIADVTQPGDYGPGCFDCFNEEDYLTDTDGDGIPDTYLGDGYPDLVVKFDAKALAAAIRSAARDECVVLTLTGETLDGDPFEASDSMIIRTKIK